MNSEQIRILEQQYRRIRAYLYIAGQNSLIRYLENDWARAETWCDRDRVIAQWVRSIADSEYILTGGGDYDHAA